MPVLAVAGIFRAVFLGEQHAELVHEHVGYHGAARADQ